MAKSRIRKGDYSVGTLSAECEKNAARPVDFLVRRLGAKAESPWLEGLMIRAILESAYLTGSEPLESLKPSARQSVIDAWDRLMQVQVPSGKIGAGSWDSDAWATAQILMLGQMRALEPNSDPVRLQNAARWLSEEVRKDWPTRTSIADFSPSFPANTAMAFIRLAQSKRAGFPSQDVLLKRVRSCAHDLISEANYEGDWIDSGQVTSQCLVALMEMGIKDDNRTRPLVANGIRWLQGRQLPDGSWRRDLIETANVLIAFARAGKTDSFEYANAINFLLATQEKHDGTWFHEPRFTAWGLLGLSSWNAERTAASLSPQASVVVLDDSVPKGPPKNNVLPRKVTLSILRTGAQSSNDSAPRDVVIFEDERSDEKLLEPFVRQWDDRFLAQECAGITKTLDELADAGCSRGAAGDQMRAAQMTATFREFGSRLETNILPQDYGDALRELGDRSLVLVETDNRALLSMPFELLPGTRGQGTGADFLAEKCAMGFRLVTSTRHRTELEEEAWRPGRRQLSVLLIGNLESAIDLPHSSKEPALLARALGENLGFSVQCVPELGGSKGATRSELSDVLHRGDWDIVHYTGHLHADAETGEPFIMCAGDERLTPEEFARWIRGNDSLPPRLVFLNACSSGATSQTGFVETLRHSGVRLVVATRAKVSDDLSAGLAKEFYQELLKGVCVGYALLDARNHARIVNEHDPSWLYFTIFGDPTIPLLPSFV